MYSIVMTSATPEPLGLPSFVRGCFSEETFPADCFLEWAKGLTVGHLPQLDEAIQIVGEAGQLDSLRERVQQAHRTHHQDKDERVGDILTEAVALAWCRTLGHPDAVLSPPYQQGPDICISQDAAMEVKAIHGPRSPSISGSEQAEVLDVLTDLQGPPSPVPDSQDEYGSVRTITSWLDDGFWNKLTKHLDKANCQLAGFSDGTVLLHIIRWEDPVQSLGSEERLGHVSNYLRRALQPRTNLARAVVIRNFEWRSWRTIARDGTVSHA